MTRIVFLNFFYGLLYHLTKKTAPVIYWTGNRGCFYVFLYNRTKDGGIIWAFFIYGADISNNHDVEI